MLLKIVIIYLIRIFSRVFSIIPLKNNQIVFSSQGGETYGDNARYISDYLRNNYYNKFHIIWRFKEPSKYKYLKEKGILVIGYQSLRGLYYCCTSKIIINTTGPQSWFKRRVGQTIIETWHGGGAYKKSGLDINNLRKGFWGEELTKKYSYKNISIFLSSCHAFSQIIRNSFQYNNEIMECGMPRNDFLMRAKDDELFFQIKRDLGIPVEKKVLLFAPTWRDENVIYHIPDDFVKLPIILNMRFGGEWIILVRSHYFSVFDKEDRIFFDASKYPDMQELLYISDVLITDYSSCMWDMSLMYKPIFLYVPDLELYDRERGFYTDPYSWGFPLCKTYFELKQAILEYDEIEYHDIVKKHQADLGICETGHATELVCERICEACRINGDGK